MDKYYKILEVDINSSFDNIKQAYKNLAKKYHPDLNESNPRKDLIEEKFREIKTAY